MQGRNELKTWVKTGLPINRNGYLYVYTSNESPVDVFFDNLQVTHVRGPLQEETHYYPFGLTMAGISSKAAGKLENRYKYNGNKLESGEFSDGSGLEMYDFNARTYDHQIGRFMQIDPEMEDGQESWTPYHFGFNNPILHNDPNGRQPNPFLIIARGIYYLAKLSQETPVGPLSTMPRALNDGTAVVRSAMPLSVKKEFDTQENINQSKSEEAKGGTYVLKDENGKVQRSGRTNDLKRREKEHARSEKTKDLEFEEDKRTDDKDAQRGREQQLHEKHKPPMNKIKPISDKNPNKGKYMEAAKKLENQEKSQPPKQ